MPAPTAWVKCDTAFQFICIITTFGTLIWCFYEFARNDDLCQVTFKKFNSDKDAIYPHISLCFEKPFSRNEYEHHGKETLEKYFEFLEGNSQDPNWLNSSYDEFTIAIGDHLITSFLDDPHLSGKMTKIQVTATSLLTMKCFTMDLPPDVKVYEFWLAVQTSIFPIRMGRNPGSFLIGMTYPHQIFSMGDQYSEYWPKIDNETINSYMTKLEIKGVEILKSRNTFHDECIESNNFDDEMTKRVMGIANCTPPYWKQRDGQMLPLCSTLDSFRQIRDQTWQAILKEGQFESHSNPCKQIKKLDYNFEDLQIDEMDKSTSQVLDSQGKVIILILVNEKNSLLYHMMNIQNSHFTISS